jgi:cell division cycle 2-like protein
MFVQASPISLFGNNKYALSRSLESVDIVHKISNFSHHSIVVLHYVFTTKDLARSFHFFQEAFEKAKQVALEHQQKAAADLAKAKQRAVEVQKALQEEEKCRSAETAKTKKRPRPQSPPPSGFEAELLKLDKASRPPPLACRQPPPIIPASKVVLSASSTESESLIPTGSEISEKDSNDVPEKSTPANTESKELLESCHLEDATDSNQAEIISEKEIFSGIDADLEMKSAVVPPALPDRSPDVNQLDDSEEPLDQSCSSNRAAIIQMGCAVHSSTCRNAADCYEPLARLADGTYGVVYRVKCKRSGKLLVVKKLKKLQGQDGFQNYFLREISFLTRIVHPNIVVLKEVVTGNKPGEIYIALEHMDWEMRKFMDAMKHHFSLSQVKCLLLQLLKALCHLHKLFIIHRDLKTANLLYSRGELKLCDFGEARLFSDPPVAMTKTVQSLRYRAPEILLGQANGLYTCAADMWSAGCIFYEFLTLRPPVRGESEIQQAQLMFALIGTPTNESWPEYKTLPNSIYTPKNPVPAGELRKHFSNSPQGSCPRTGKDLIYLSDNGFELLQAMLTLDPSKRISAQDALNHAFFQEEPFACSPRELPKRPP